MKRVLSILFVLLLAVGSVLFGFTSAADTSDELSDLYEAKYAFDQTGEYYFENPEVTQAYYSQVEECYLLLYTDLLDTWTFVPTSTEYIPGLLFNCEYFCPELYGALKSTYDVGVWPRKYNMVGITPKEPPLLVCVEYFGLTKDDVLRARQKMLDDPYCIKEKLIKALGEDNWYAEVYMRMLSKKTVDDILPDFMVEALFLADREEAKKMLLLPFAMVMDGGVFTPYLLTENSAEQLLSFDYDYEQFERFYAYCREQYAAVAEYKSDGWRANKQKYLNILAKIEAKLHSSAPDTGDPTVSYIFLSSICFSAACGALTVVRKRKKKDPTADVGDRA